MIFIINFKQLDANIMNNEKYSFYLSFVPFMQYAG